MSHTKEDLKELQSKSLEEKIQISTARIIEWYEYWDGKVYISNSGGVDSTVLSDLVHRVYPNVPDVYCDTGLEYPELREFIMSKSNVIVLKPSVYNRKSRQYEHITFPEVITRYGYPLISKELSYAVYSAKNGSQYGIDKMNGVNPDGTINPFRQGNIKWKYLTDGDIPLANQCCYIMKKHPAKIYEKQTNYHPFIGTMAQESTTRKTAWLRTGCNAFNGDRPSSKPLSFWSKSDVLKYLLKFNVPYCSAVYGDIVCEGGVYTTTKQKRTGCVFCGYGCHLEHPNKFQILAQTHPQLYDYCMRGGKYDESTGMWIPDKGLGMAKVLDYINVKWWNDGDETRRDEYRAKYKEKEEIEQSRKKSSQTD